jgi:hypothetical protein
MSRLYYAATKRFQNAPIMTQILTEKGYYLRYNHRAAMGIAKIQPASTENMQHGDDENEEKN